MWERSPNVADVVTDAAVVTGVAFTIKGAGPMVRLPELRLKAACCFDGKAE